MQQQRQNAEHCGYNIYKMRSSHVRVTESHLNFNIKHWIMVIKWSAATPRARIFLRRPKCLSHWKSPLNPAFLHSWGPAALFPPSCFFTLNPAMICIRGQEVRDSLTESDIWILCSQSQRVCTFPPNFSAAQRLRGEIWTNSVSISADSSCKGGTKVHFCDVLQTHLSRSLERLQDSGLRHPWWKKKRTLLYF